MEYLYLSISIKLYNTNDVTMYNGFDTIIFLKSYLLPFGVKSNFDIQNAYQIRLTLKSYLLLTSFFKQ